MPVLSNVEVGGRCEDLAHVAWQWFRANEDRVLFERGFWFFRVRVRVGHFRSLLEELFGPEPSFL